MTELTRQMAPDVFQAAFMAMHDQHLALGNAPFEVKSVGQGAATTLRAGVVADPILIGGRYCEDCHVGELLPDDVSTSAFNPGVRAYALDPVHAEALWAKAGALVGEIY
jgi:hypothetical protein